jgi:2-keto-4-pentenoate hydratase/2-oxohepta-3-ene-1,7-dioic acid hydratase in catechol pathway
MTLADPLRARVLATTSWVAHGMIFDVATLVTACSEAMALQHDDICEIEVEGLGVLRNPIVGEV